MLFILLSSKTISFQMFYYLIAYLSQLLYCMKYSALSMQNIKDIQKKSYQFREVEEEYYEPFVLV